jgi:hypothetical protein
MAKGSPRRAPPADARLERPIVLAQAATREGVQLTSDTGS